MALASATQALSEGRVAKFLLSDDTQTSVSLLVVGASLAPAIAANTCTGTWAVCREASPVWLKYGYYMVEISSTIARVSFFAARHSGGCWGWLRASAL